jgi:hypothetical protein
MCYLTLRVVSPPRSLLAVAALRRVPAYNYNKPYTQNSEKPEPYYTLPASAGILQHVAWCIGYPIPCLGKDLLAVAAGRRGAPARAVRAERGRRRADSTRLVAPDLLPRAFHLIGLAVPRLSLPPVRIPAYPRLDGLLHPRRRDRRAAPSAGAGGRPPGRAPNWGGSGAAWPRRCGQSRRARPRWQRAAPQPMNRFGA